MKELVDMPELPEVETVVRGLRDDMQGRTFTGATVEWPGELDTLGPEEFADRLVGQRVEGMRRRGKYIIFDLDHDALLVHLKMTGRLYIQDKGEVNEDDRWVRVSFGLDDGRTLQFSDLRKFGRVYLVGDAEEVVGKLGPEPLEDDFTLDVFRERIAKRHGVIKPLLLNQAFVAGVGNIYADEALWLSQINPHRMADTLADDEVAQLHEAIRAVLQEAIDYEGTTMNWYRKPDGTAGGYQERFKVYGRGDEPCLRCGTAISKVFLAQRGTHFCPQCQK